MTAPNAAPAVAVVIPNFNGASFITATLDALAAQSVAPAEVVVVDNGSADRSLDVVRAHPLGVTAIGLRHNVGFAGGANAGVRSTTAPLVAVLNSDARPDPSWLAELLAVVDTSGADVWAWGSVLVSARTGRIESAGDTWAERGAATKLLRDRPLDDLPDQPYDVFSPPGAAPLFRRTVFEDLGGYEERFFLYYEDIDLSFRARLRGWRAVMVPSARVTHDLGRSSSSPASARRARWFIARNSLWCSLRCAPELHPRALWRTTQRELATAKRCRGARRAYLAGRLAGAIGAPRALAERRAIQRTAVVRTLADLVPPEPRPVTRSRA